MVVEVGAAVLHDAEGGDSGIGHGGDVGAGGIGGGLEDRCADALENGLNGAEGVDGSGEGFDVEAERMGSAGVAFDGGDVVREVRRSTRRCRLCCRSLRFLRPSRR